MIRKDHELVVVTVVALLKGINIDGETMQHILEEVKMTDQIHSQLVPDEDQSQLVPDEDQLWQKLHSPRVIHEISDSIFNDLYHEGVEIVKDYDLAIDGKKLYLDDIRLNEDRVKKIITDVLQSHFTL